MEDINSSPWILWKIQFTPEFKTERFANLKSLKFAENILGECDLSKDYFALFRNGISPDIYDKRNNYAFKHKLVDETHLDIYRSLWDIEIFRQPFINGVHFKPDEISIWMNIQNNNEHSDQQPAEERANFFLDATGIFWNGSSVFNDSLKCPWTIGFSNKYKLDLTMFQDTVESEEHLATLLQNTYQLSQNEKCIILKSDLLHFDEWRIPNSDNRLVYCSVKTSLQNANKIMKRFMLTLTISIFPHIRLIYAAFCRFEDDNLELGIYITGKESLLVPNIRRFRAGPDDFAFTTAHKLKQIVLSELSAETDVKVLIRNSIPPVHFDFINPDHQCQTHGNRTYLQYL